MSALPKKHGGWADEAKKGSKKNVLENIDIFERYLSPTGSREGENATIDIPEIEEIQSLDEISEPPTKAVFNKELNVDVLKKNPINVDDKTDLSILFHEALDPENEIEEPDEVWHWNQLFTNVSAQISDEK